MPSVPASRRQPDGAPASSRPPALSHLKCEIAGRPGSLYSANVPLLVGRMAGKVAECAALFAKSRHPPPIPSPRPNGRFAAGESDARSSGRRLSLRWSSPRSVTGTSNHPYTYPIRGDRRPPNSGFVRARANVIRETKKRIAPGLLPLQALQRGRFDHQDDPGGLKIGRPRTTAGRKSFMTFPERGRAKAIAVIKRNGYEARFSIGLRVPALSARPAR